MQTQNLTLLRLILAVLAAIAPLALAVYYFWPAGEVEVQASISPAEALAGDVEGYLRAEGPREFMFPDDHGPHLGYRTEWWYYTGNLEAETGDEFGYQFTIFRNQLAPPDTAEDPRDSDWATDQLYMAHFAVSDLQAEEHVAAERMSRGAAGLAGAQAEPFHIWLEGWSAEGVDGTVTPTRIRAGEEGMAIDLTVTPLKPVILQGEAGYDRKGPEPGNASYYVSFTRMATEGTVTFGDESYEVEGLSWMDHEWSTSALTEGQVGWDWFSLQLSNEMDLMYYQFREEDGGISPFTSGTVVGADGSTRSLTDDDVALDVLETWTSPETGGTYPVRWRLRIPSDDLDLTVEAAFPEQEMDVSVNYWEGAVRLQGTHRGLPVEGRGYVEMTGYADIPPER